MKIVKFSKMKDNRYKVVLDNELDVTLYDDVIVKYNLLVNKELDQYRLDEILAINDKFMAYYEALAYINKKLRTQKEIIKYLEKKYKKEIIDYVLDKLIKENYVNNKIYIECFVNDQINLSTNGPYKIKDKLLELGFQEEEIDDYLRQINDEVWLLKLRKIINKKIKSNHKHSESKLKEKLVYDLVNLGYERKIVIDEVNDIEIDNNESLIKEYTKLLNKLSKKYGGRELELQLITKLMSRGFNYDEVKEIIKNSNLDD